MSNQHGRNSPCWCGSGRKYKHCHLRREQQDRLPIPAIKSNLRRHFRQQRGCLFPKCPRDAIQSHTIQRGGAIREIVDFENHVLTFYPVTNDVDCLPSLHRRGWKKASTFLGFCNNHDTTVFSPLESDPFTASPEQLFLLAYRAHCHELYQKRSVLSSQDVYRDLGDRGVTTDKQMAFQSLSDSMFAGATKALGELTKLKKVMDGDLLSRNYQNWRSCVFQFSGPLSVTGTGAFTPNVDLDGLPLQTLHDPSAKIHYLYYAAVPCGEGCAVAFVWHNEHSYAHAFIESVRKLDVDLIPHTLLQFLFAYCENTYFSQKWWDGLLDCGRQQIRILAGVGNPYYDDFEFVTDGIAPWRLTEMS